MEAIALHDYTAENDKELSIEKGCRLTILNPDHSGDWYMGDTGEKNGLVPRNYVQLLPYSWYKGKVPSSTVKLHLLSQPTDGAFIVHDSESCLGDLEISAKFGDNVLSYRILRDTSGKYFLWTFKFDSVNDLVEYHRKASISRDFDNLFLKGKNLQMTCVMFLTGTPPPPPPPQHSPIQPKFSHPPKKIY